MVSRLKCTLVPLVVARLDRRIDRKCLGAAVACTRTPTSPGTVLGVSSDVTILAEADQPSYARLLNILAKEVPQKSQKVAARNDML